MLERLWVRVEKTSGCWLWRGATTADGYGLIKNDSKRTMLVHRATWEAEHGAVPDGHELDHVCNTRRCVRPAHLDLVTHAENMRRLVERRRQLRQAESQWVELLKESMP